MIVLSCLVHFTSSSTLVKPVTIQDIVATVPVSCSLFTGVTSEISHTFLVGVALGLCLIVAYLIITYPIVVLVSLSFCDQLSGQGKTVN
jgi:hypothetical protein